MPRNSYKMLDYFALITLDTFSLVPGCLSISCKTSVSSVMTCFKGNTGSAVPLFMTCIFCGGLGTKDTASARPLRTRSLSLNHRTWGEVITAVSHLMILIFQGCALAEPGGPWRLTFALGQLENLRFFIQIICWAP